MVVLRVGIVKGRGNRNPRPLTALFAYFLLHERKQACGASESPSLHEKFLIYFEIKIKDKICHEVWHMKFELKKTKEKQETVYKTIYIKRSLVEQIDRIATENGTSFNNVVVSMIEACLKDE